MTVITRPVYPTYRFSRGGRGDFGCWVYVWVVGSWRGVIILGMVGCMGISGGLIIGNFSVTQQLLEI